MKRKEQKELVALLQKTVTERDEARAKIRASEMWMEFQRLMFLVVVVVTSFWLSNNIEMLKHSKNAGYAIGWRFVCFGASLGIGGIAYLIYGKFGKAIVNRCIPKPILKDIPIPNDLALARLKSLKAKVKELQIEGGKTIVPVSALLQAQEASLSDASSMQSAGNA